MQNCVAVILRTYTLQKNVEFQSLTPMVFFDRKDKRFCNPRTRRDFFMFFSFFKDHVECFDAPQKRVDFFRVFGGFLTNRAYRFGVDNLRNEETEIW